LIIAVVFLESKDSNIIYSRTVEQTTIAETTNLGLLVNKRFHYLQFHGMLRINSTNSNYGLDLNFKSSQFNHIFIRNQEKQSCELKEIAL
jgi:hypothetical protein